MHLLLYHQQGRIFSVWFASRLFKPSAHKRLSELCTYIPYSRVQCRYSLLFPSSQRLPNGWRRSSSRKSLGNIWEMDGWEKGIPAYLLHRYLLARSQNSKLFHADIYVIISVFDDNIVLGESSLLGERKMNKYKWYLSPSPLSLCRWTQFIATSTKIGYARIFLIPVLAYKWIGISCLVFLQRMITAECSTWDFSDGILLVIKEAISDVVRQIFLAFPMEPFFACKRPFWSSQVSAQSDQWNNVGG